MDKEESLVDLKPNLVSGLKILKDYLTTHLIHLTHFIYHTYLMHLTYLTYFTYLTYLTHLCHVTNLNNSKYSQLKDPCFIFHIETSVLYVLTYKY